MKKVMGFCLILSMSVLNGAFYDEDLVVGRGIEFDSRAAEADYGSDSLDFLISSMSVSKSPAGSSQISGLQQFLQPYSPSSLTSQMGAAASDDRKNRPSPKGDICHLNEEHLYNPGCSPSAIARKKKIAKEKSQEALFTKLPRVFAQGEERPASAKAVPSKNPYGWDKVTFKRNISEAPHKREKGMRRSKACHDIQTSYGDDASIDDVDATKRVESFQARRPRENGKDHSSFLTRLQRAKHYDDSIDNLNPDLIPEPKNLPPVIPPKKSDISQAMYPRIGNSKFLEKFQKAQDLDGSIVEPDGTPPVIDPKRMVNLKSIDPVGPPPIIIDTIRAENLENLKRVLALKAKKN